MAGRKTSGKISEAEYARFLQTLSSTAKGRRFLEEHGRRSQPDDSLTLGDSLQRIETAIREMREQLQPDRIAEEMQRVAMTLEIALDETKPDPEGSNNQRRFALIERARSELLSLARSIGGPQDRIEAR